MTPSTTCGEIPACIPLEIKTGHRCFLTLRVGPVWCGDGALLALELLSDVRDSMTGKRLSPEVFFSRTPPGELLRILNWQLDMVRERQSWFRERNLRVSVNFTRSLAIGVLTAPETARQINQLRDILRLELSEYFITPGGTGCDALVQGMGELAPLWLDDFGCGSTPYTCLTEGHFEAVKLDRCFVKRLYRMSGGTEFIRGLSGLMAGTDTQLIAEGISEPALWDFARHAGVAASQGWLWPEVYMDSLNTLPVRLPL
ncbi:EAL domain-containing protein [Citrobacter portucalensis]|uniref:EAL domain-containing protein n=1 Tax=Citrobacter portucalensis TaxID=1639133 RepID=UPI001F457269